MQGTPVRFLDQEDPLEKGQATHSSILAWRIPWVCNFHFPFPSPSKLKDLHTGIIPFVSCTDTFSLSIRHLMYSILKSPSLNKTLLIWHVLSAFLFLCSQSQLKSLKYWSINKSFKFLASHFRLSHSSHILVLSTLTNSTYTKVAFDLHLAKAEGQFSVLTQPLGGTWSNSLLPSLTEDFWYWDNTLFLLSYSTTHTFPVSLTGCCFFPDL